MSLATTPLRFANPSPPSGWIEDLHLQAVGHARHTRRSRASGLTCSLAEAIRGFVLGFCCRSAAVCRKSFVFSSLPIRKVLVLPFAGGVSPSLGWFLFCLQRVIHRIVAPTTCSLTTCSLTTCKGVPFHRNPAGECVPFHRNPAGECVPFHRGKLPRITQACGNERLAALWPLRGSKHTESPTRRRKAADGPLRGRNREISLLADLDLTEESPGSKARGSKPLWPSYSSTPARPA